MQPVCPAPKGIVAAMITYNDMPLVCESIESIYPQVERIVVIDGRYADFPGKEWLSNDGTREYLLGLDKVTVVDGPGLLENEKRNLYLEGLADFQTLLVLDSDEVVEGKLCTLDYDIGLVPFWEGGRKQMLATRLFRYREGLRYGGVHYVLETLQGRPFNTRHHAAAPFTDIKITSFAIRHQGQKRSDGRKFAKAAYYKNLIIREVAYRKKAKFPIK